VVLVSHEARVSYVELAIVLAAGAWIGFAVGLSVARRVPLPARDLPATNVYAVLTLAYCPFTDRLTHEDPVPARITYNPFLMQWSAGCAECGTHANGSTPEEAARRWNLMADQPPLRVEEPWRVEDRVQ
jgi:hypothetical protein